MKATKTLEEINAILDNVRIEDVVGEIIPLKQRGLNYIGKCPFCRAKGPTLCVSPVHQIYKCFHCGRAGSVLSFTMEAKHLTRDEALDYLKENHIKED